MTTVGIDLGSTHVTVLATDGHGRIVARARRPRTAQLAAAVGDTYREARDVVAHVDAVGVTLPSRADGGPDPLAVEIMEEIGTAALTVPPGHALALAETWCGAAQGCLDVVAFSIAEHVTAGILAGGSLLRGANGDAGAVAWMALNPVEREDYRRYGGLEAEVAAAGIIRRFVWRIKSGDRSSVADDVAGDLSRVTVAQIVAAAREGDGVCVAIVRDTARYVGVALANLATIVDPECLVLGGTLASSGDLMLDAIRTECSRHLRPAQCDRLRIELSTLGADAPAIGAARAAQLQRS